MKKSRFSEEKIIAVLKQAEAGVKVSELVRKLGISEAGRPAASAATSVDRRADRRRMCREERGLAKVVLSGRECVAHAIRARTALTPRPSSVDKAIPRPA